MTQLHLPKFAKVNYTTLWTHSGPAKVDLCALAIETCEFALKHMFNHIHSNKTIQVLIEVPSPNEDGSSPLGTCSNQVLEGVIPGIITVKISPFQTHEEFINTIFHELTHARQIFEGRLNSSRIRHGDNPTITLWNKRAFSTRTMDYYDLPWEIEARYEAERLTELMQPQNAILAAIAAAAPKTVAA